MPALREYQKEALRLLHKGKKPDEIKRVIKMDDLADVLKRARDNIAEAISTIRFAAENGALSEDQIRELKAIMAKAYIP